MLEQTCHLDSKEIKSVSPKGNQPCIFIGRTQPYIYSVLQNRDITLPTKVHLIKAMVFPVVMYGCESWTIEKAEHQRIDVLNCGVGEDS